MKINDQMRYPHPVLSEYSQDYALGKFECSFEQQMTEKGELAIAAQLDLRCDDLLHLVNSQQAGLGYFLVCRRTYFNRLQEAPSGRSQKFFDAAKLFGTVTIRPVVWSLAAVPNYSSRLIHKEFGSTVSLPKGSILALGPEFRLSIDKKKFKPFETIFELAESATVPPGTVQVDPMLDRITILAEPKTYKDLADMRNMAKGKRLLLNAVYLPAIMDVLAALQAGETSLTNKSWYRVFKAKCDDLGIDPMSRNKSPLTIAQMLLKAPLKQTIIVTQSV